MENYYRLLGVRRRATEEEIKRAYRKAAMKHHPDSGNAFASDEMFRKVTDAYNTLKDPIKRKEYDEKYDMFLAFESMKNVNVEYEQTSYGQEESHLAGHQRTEKESLVEVMIRFFSASKSLAPVVVALAAIFVFDIHDLSAIGGWTVFGTFFMTVLLNWHKYLTRWFIAWLEIGVSFVLAMLTFAGMYIVTGVMIRTYTLSMPLSILICTFFTALIPGLLMRDYIKHVKWIDAKKIVKIMEMTAIIIEFVFSVVSGVIIGMCVYLYQ